MLLSEAARGADLLQAAAARQALAPRVAALLARAISLGTVATRLAEHGLISAAPRAAAERQTGLLVRGLGAAQVLRDGQEIPRASWGAQRPRELLFYLIHNMPVTRDLVLNTFWPEMPQARAVANLHQTLWRMRKAVGTDVITLDETGFRPAPGLVIHSDVIQFEALGRAAVGFARSDMRRLGALESAVKSIHRRVFGRYQRRLGRQPASQPQRALHSLVERICRRIDGPHPLYGRAPGHRARPGRRAPARRPPRAHVDLPGRPRSAFGSGRSLSALPRHPAQ